MSPRSALAEWANHREEWIRRIVEIVLATEEPLPDEDVQSVFELFLQEHGLVERSLPTVGRLSLAYRDDREQPSLALTGLSDVLGVNALVAGQTLEFNDNLTLIFGENGSGKTGYARILKALAGSRSVDQILPDVTDGDAHPAPSAVIEYRLGDERGSYVWSGERAVEPFSRTLVFDSPAASLHLDQSLTYSFRPASLGLFDFTNDAIHRVQEEIGSSVETLLCKDADLKEHFDKGSPLYAAIEGLDAETDIDDLSQLCKLPDGAETQLQQLGLQVAELEADLPAHQVALQTRLRDVLAEATSFSSAVVNLEADRRHALLSRLADLQEERAALRNSLFLDADLPAEPEATWEAFIRAGGAYREHLEGVGRHEPDRCLYCRQRLNDPSRRLIDRYGEYLEDRVARDIREAEQDLEQLGGGILDVQITAVRLFVEQMRSEKAPDLQVKRQVLRLLVQLTEYEESIRASLEQRKPLDDVALKAVIGSHPTFKSALSEIDQSLRQLNARVSGQSRLLAEAKAERTELDGRLRLKREWPRVVGRVENLQRVARLERLRMATSHQLRQLTALSKSLSNEMVNRNFQVLFRSECDTLRAPHVELDFIGRQSQAQRRKAVPGAQSPSQVFSEGEQKVLALADFLAEARLHGPVGPIVLDDPVSSLDYRRVAEVAARIAGLAAEYQVVVFTHDIFLAAHLLTHFDGSLNCSLYQVRDEAGVGRVERATGLRTDSVGFLAGRINDNIQDASAHSGEQRSELIRNAYAWIRSWCEVFVERELLAGVTERYQPNVRMTALRRIKASELEVSIETVLGVFKDASRFMSGHSQPGQQLMVEPTLVQLEEDWEKLQQCRRSYNKAG